MNLRNKGMLAKSIALALVILLAVPWMVFADNLYSDSDNNLVVATPTGAVTVNAGSSANYTAYYYVKDTNGKANLDDLSSTVSVTLNKSGTAAGFASLGSTSLTFSNYMDAEVKSVNINITVPAGTAPNDYILTVTPSTSVATNVLNVANGVFTLTVTVPGSVDTTPPTVNITSGPAEDDWISTNSVYFAWSGDDGTNGSPPVTFAWKLDGGDWSGYSSATSCTINDLSEGNHTFSVKAKDSATPLNESGPVSRSFKVDTTAPTVTWGSPNPAANANGWHKADVTIPYTVSDGSGIGVDGSTSGVVTITGEGANLNGAVTVSDLLSNSASYTSPSVKIDRTKPTITSTSISNGATFILNERNGEIITCEATDTLSGIDSTTTTTLDTSSVGNKTLTVSATDKAGNTEDININYSVVYAHTGILQPINTTGPISAFKKGSTVPVKFQLKDVNGTPIKLSAMPTIKISKVTMTGMVITENEAVVTTSAATTGNLFRYDDNAGQYIYNLGTKDYTAGCFYKITVENIPDGLTDSAIIQIK